jgi:hypothetical protein
MGTRQGEPMRYLLNVIETSRGPGDCILWPYMKMKHGYGGIKVPVKDDPTRRQRNITVVRFIMIAIDGPDRPGWCVAHAPSVCHTPACIRPAHLRWATTQENSLDRVTDGTCKLRPDLAVEIRSRYSAGGITQGQLAREYGVTPSLVSRIVRGKVWVAA